MELHGLGKIVIITGIILIAVGLLIVLSPKIPFIGRLPGDFIFKRGGISFYFPLATSILLGIILSLVLSFIFRGK